MTWVQRYVLKQERDEYRAYACALAVAFSLLFVMFLFVIVRGQNLLQKTKAQQAEIERFTTQVKGCVQ